MHNSNYPIFTKGRVVKKESLEYLRDFPYGLVSLALGDYSDGILFGFSVRLEDECIVISKGAVKREGQVIVIPESRIAFNSYGQRLFVKMFFHELRITEDFQIRPIEIRIDQTEPVTENEIELGRFRLARGAELRNEYDSVNDFSTGENTLDITHAPYAGINAPTLHPAIVKEYARSLLANSQNAADVAFAMMCLNASVIHKESIQWHIAQKSGRPYSDCTLPELYGKLAGQLPREERKPAVIGGGKTVRFGPSIS